MTARRWALIFVLLVCAACGDDDDAGAGSVPRVWLFPDSGFGEQAGLSGTLDYNREFDCFFMRESGEAIVWPLGTTGTGDGPGVVLPSGETARVGDVVTGTGGHHSGDIAAHYEVAPECVTDSLTVFQFDEISVNP